MNELLEDNAGKKVFLLGNEAIVRGAIEGGLDFAATYPGTPSSEIGNTLFKIGKEAGVYFEFSTNEKVAMEVGAAAAMSGLRTLVFMKHVGINVASDAYMTLAYTGVRGGMVILSADDPGCHSSQNEQDNRYYAQMANIPMFEPANPQEAKDMTTEGLKLSEKIGLPILLRTTTRVNHVSAPVTFGPKEPQRGKGHFEKDSSKYVVTPAHAKVLHGVLLEKMAKVKEVAETHAFNFRDGKKDASVGVITSGVGYNYAKDLADDEDLDLEFLKLGFSHPFPTKLVSDFIKGKERIIIVEEGEPYLEKETMSLAQREKIAVEIRGKTTGDFPYNNEYDPDVLRCSFSEILGKDMCLSSPIIPEAKLPKRPPSLCAGCPHRATFYAMNKAFRGKDVVHCSDIGCYTLGIQAPHHTTDIVLCMGGSIGAAGGISKATDQFPVAILGDSTFFHAGLSGMVNTVYNDDDLIYIIVDNRTTAMTGHQPNPGMGVNGRGEPAPMIDIGGVCQACGASSVRTIDPYNLKATIEVFKEAKDEKGVRVVIPKRECALIVPKILKAQGVSKISQEECKKCNVCINQFACPAFYKKGDEVHIDPAMCAGCHVCIQVCPFDAIHVDEKTIKIKGESSPNLEKPASQEGGA